MPFNTRAAFKLTLAIAAICAQAAQAQDSGERLWSCNLTPSGEWDCEVNEELMQQESAPPARPVTTTSARVPVEEPPTSEQQALATESSTEPVAPERGALTSRSSEASVVRSTGPAPIEWPTPVTSQSVA